MIRELTLATMLIFGSSVTAQDIILDTDFEIETRSEATGKKKAAEKPKATPKKETVSIPLPVRKPEPPPPKTDLSADNASAEDGEVAEPGPVLDGPSELNDALTEAGIFCQNCGRTNILDLQAVVKGVKKLNRIDSWNKSRGLVQIPVEAGNIGPCGSFHYNPDGYNFKKKSGEVVDNYAAPVTACAFMALLQKWKQRCPDRGDGCRIAWGDISHKTRRKFNGHATHTDGNCIDIRPFRKGDFVAAPLTYGASAYSRQYTKEFIKMAKEMGASPVYFNDPKSGGSPMSGHSNHLHICFHNNNKGRKTCANYEYNSAICGEM